jgi:hypothetical protein
MGVIRDIMGIAKDSGSLFGRNKNKSSGKHEGGGDEGDNWSGSFKRGGKVRKTGVAKVHKGEQVLTAKQAKRYKRGRGKSR